MTVDAGQRLWTTAAVNEELSRAQAVIFLVGSYDGSGNFGDIAQYEAALEIATRFSETALVLPVIELGHLPMHERLVEEEGWDARTPLLFASFRSGEESGPRSGELLEPAVVSSGLLAAAAYLYGGGYLNSQWGGRKLAMLGAVQALVRPTRARSASLVSSGLQIDADWIRSLAAEQRRELSRLAVIGVRDAESLDAAEAIPPSPQARRLVSGDDAVSVIAAHRPRHLGSPDQETAAPAPTVNVHLCTEGWVTADPDRLISFMTELVSGVCDEIAGPLRIRPLIAYEDDRVSERPVIEAMLDRLSCLEGITAIEAPLLLRPASLAIEADVIRRGGLTLASSYHVTLTSLMLGVPAALLRENPYYEQKGHGLSAAFELPPELGPRVGEDGRAAGSRLARAAFDPATALRNRIAVAGARVIATRLAAETVLTAAIGSGFAEAALNAAARDGGAPASADALHELSVLREDYQQLLRRLGPAQRSYAEMSARLREQDAVLADLRSSTSWRLTAPLRRLGAAARRGERRL